MKLPLHRLAAALCLAAAVGACAGAPSSTSAPATPEPAPAAPGNAAARPSYTEADVRFMQGMLAHHAQALVMTAMVPSRAAHPWMRLLAERIEVSQQGEIAQMQRWLRERGEMVPALDDPHAHHGAGERMLMPGMLTAEELARLEQATGTAFDRLFLELMIRHHEGALVMVQQLFGSPGAGQTTEIYTFASDVEADQRAEIERMRALLARLGGG